MESYLFPAFRQMWFAKNISGEMALRSKAFITVAKYPDGGMAMTFPTLKTWQRNRHCLLDVVQRTAPLGPQAAKTHPKHSIQHRQNRALALPLECGELQSQG